MTTTCLYAANRSPTGHATALLCTLVDGTWGHLSETAPCQRVILPAGEPLFLTSEEAIAAARRRWKCERPLGRASRTRIPTPFLITDTSHPHPYNLRCDCDACTEHGRQLLGAHG